MPTPPAKMATNATMLLVKEKSRLILNPFSVADGVRTITCDRVGFQRLSTESHSFERRADVRIRRHRVNGNTNSSASRGRLLGARVRIAPPAGLCQLT